MSPSARALRASSEGSLKQKRISLEEYWWREGVAANSMSEQLEDQTWE